MTPRVPARPVASGRAALILSTALVLTPLSGLWAQDSGGVLYRFGLTQDVTHTSNPGLENPAADPQTLARTRLSFDMIRETDVQQFQLSARGALELGDGADDGLASPSLRLSYSREAAAARLSASAFLNEQDVDTLEFELGLDEDGNPVVSQATGSGRQRQMGGSVALELGRDGPFGGRFSLSRSDTSYFDTSDPDLVDSTRDTAQLRLRFDLSPVTSLSATARNTRLDQDGGSNSETNSLSLRLANDRPDGVVDITASATRTEAGTRNSLSFGRSLQMPSGSLSARLGLGQTAAGGSQLIGSLDWRQDLPRGRLDVAFDQSVTENSNDDEIRLASLSVGLSQELGARLSGRVQMGLRNTLDTGDDEETRSATATVSLNYALTEDWSLGLSTTHRMRDDDSSGQSESTSVSLSLSRVFEMRR